VPYLRQQPGFNAHILLTLYHDYLFPILLI
jgi:hypothetical protein